MVDGAWWMVNGGWWMVHGTWCMVPGGWCLVGGAPLLDDYHRQVVQVRRVSQTYGGPTMVYHTYYVGTTTLTVLGCLSGQ